MVYPAGCAGVVYTAANEDNPATQSLFMEHADAVGCLTLSLDGATAATAEAGKIILWDVATCKVSAVLSGFTAPIVALDFSGDGSKVRVGGLAGAGGGGGRGTGG